MVTLGDPGTLADITETGSRLLAAALLAGVLGLDREIRHKPLGLRTVMLIATGACAFALLVMDIVTLFHRPPGLGNVDPSRVIQGVIEGIGFLGAGAIIRDRGQVKGATTGSMMWLVGAVGMSCGFGFYIHAALFTLVAFLLLTVAGIIERWGERRGSQS
jgi:putative Mg2+ transporter-C (MgtC) family protein